MIDSTPSRVAFLVPQVLTAARLLLGGAALVAGSAGDLRTSATLLTYGSVTDGIDGPVARRLGVTSRFGILFDYFADYVCYVIGPAMIGLELLRPLPAAAAWVTVAVPLLTGAVRYARNAQRAEHEAFERVGLPGLGTVVFAFFVITVVFLDTARVLQPVVHASLIAVTMWVLSLLMISPLRYPKVTATWQTGVPILLGLAIMPFALTVPLAAGALLLGTCYTVASPLRALLRSRR